MPRTPRDPLGALGGLFPTAKPDASADSPPKAASPAVPILEVSALSARIRDALEGSIGSVKVKGEVSNARCVSGHWYFSLKDAQSRIDCVLFRGDAARSKAQPRDGASCVVSAQVTHYPPQGRTQLQCSSLEEAGAGDLDAKFRALCDEMRALGHFDSARKAQVPAVPMCMAILTSAGSAAEADCLNAAAETFPAAKIILIDVRVQGAQAAAGIAAALDAVDRAAGTLGIEVILLVRGGGSLEDLWAFNERIVAEAILRAKTPIVTGIGHESDTTIADLVADRRAPTPSRAVTETLPRRDALREETDALAHRLARGFEHLHARRVTRVDLAARSRALSDPATGIEVRATAVGQFALRLGRSVLRVLELTKSRVESNARTLDAVGPLRVLERGYSITLDAAGHAVRTASGAKVGDELRTILASGEIASTVTRTTADGARTQP